jgi:hypothetical protein
MDRGEEIASNNGKGMSEVRKIVGNRREWSGI